MKTKMLLVLLDKQLKHIQFSFYSKNYFFIFQLKFKIYFSVKVDDFFLKLKLSNQKRFFFFSKLL